MARLARGKSGQLLLARGDSHQDRVIHAHDQLRKPLLPHVPHGLVVRVERLHVHAQWRLGVFGYIKAHANVRLPVTIHVHRVGHVPRQARSPVSNQAAQTASSSSRSWFSSCLLGASLTPSQVFLATSSDPRNRIANRPCHTGKKRPRKPRYSISSDRLSSWNANSRSSSSARACRARSGARSRNSRCGLASYSSTSFPS